MKPFHEMTTEELLAVPPGAVATDLDAALCWAAELRDRMAEADGVVQALRSTPEPRIVSYRPDDSAWFCGLCHAENDHYLSCPWWLAQQVKP